MNLDKRMSVTGLALALSLGGLAAGVAGCAGSRAATQNEPAATKGADHKCGGAKSGGEKAAEKSCGAKADEMNKQADKGAEKGCGEKSCGG